MAMNQFPPQAFTRDVLAAAYEWLRSQPQAIRELAQDSNSLVALYMQSRRNPSQLARTMRASADSTILPLGSPSREKATHTLRELDVTAAPDATREASPAVRETRAEVSSRESHELQGAVDFALNSGVNFQTATPQGSATAQYGINGPATGKRGWTTQADLANTGGVLDMSNTEASASFRQDLRSLAEGMKQFEAPPRPPPVANMRTSPAPRAAASASAHDQRPRPFTMPQGATFVTPSASAHAAIGSAHMAASAHGFTNAPKNFANANFNHAPSVNQRATHVPPHDVPPIVENVNRALMEHLQMPTAQTRPVTTGATTSQAAALSTYETTPTFVATVAVNPATATTDIEAQIPTATVAVNSAAATPFATPTVGSPDVLSLDAVSLAALKNVQTKLNLSSPAEALRLLISIGHDRVREFLPKN